MQWFAVLTSNDVSYIRYSESILEDYGITGMPVKLSACANSVYQAIFLLPLESLGTRLGQFSSNFIDL